MTVKGRGFTESLALAIFPCPLNPLERMMTEHMVISGFTGRMAPAVVEQPVLLKRLDKVKIAGGSVLIVTGYHPNRPVNCYSGVMERGQGKEYVFGPKHQPVKVGTVTEDHPALQMNQDRKEARDGVPQGLLSLARLLVKTVLKGEMLTAKALAEELEAKGF